MAGFAAYGLIIESTADLAAPRSVAHRVPDVWAEVGNVSLDGIEFDRDRPIADPGAVRVVQGSDERRTILQFPGATGEIPFDEPRVRVQPDHGAPLGLAEHYLLDHVVPAWIALRSDLVLHGGAVLTPRGGAVVITGNTGRGKSSSVTGLGQLGWPVLSDDVCRVELIDGVRHVQPSYPGVRLTAATRSALTPDWVAHPLAEGAEKYRVTPEFEMPQRRSKVVAIIELGADTPEIAVSRLSFSDATFGILRQSVAQARTEAERARKAFALASDCAASIPCFRLDFPRRWDIYPDLARAIEGLS